MEKKKNNTGVIALTVLLVIVTIASLVAATYAWAKYTSTTTGSTTAVVAKWNVAGSSKDLTWSKTYTHVVAQKLAPGTSGTIPVTFGISDTEVDVHYKITLVSAENKPTNLKFYTDSTKKTPVSVGGTAYEGTIAVKGSDFSGALYWEWPYETTGGDATDTAEGTAAKTMKVQIKIDANQVQPGA